MAEVRPSHVYLGHTKEDVMRRLRECGWRPVGFRAPRPGEYWVTALQLKVTNEPTSDWLESKRLIVERVR